MKTTHLLLAGLLMAPSAQAMQDLEDPYFQIVDVSVTSKDVDAEPLMPLISGGMDQINAEVDGIIHLGKKLWKLVADNRPVVNFETKAAHALPVGTHHWTDLEGWQAPKAKVYEIAYKNGLGMDVVVFSYRILYTYGGSYDGQGQYLTRVVALPGELTVAWGYTVEAQAEVASVVNQGTKSDPHAGMELAVRWKVDTVLRSTQVTQSYFVSGNGAFVNLSQGSL